MAAEVPMEPKLPTQAEGAEPAAEADGLLSAEELAAKEAAQQEAAEREAALNRLMQRISKNSNFPSLRDSIRSIQKVARSDTAHRRVFSDHLLNDVALTAKLLRLINAAYYSSVGAGTITSIDRALALMGFQAVGMLAGSLMLFEKMPKGPGAEHVKQSFNRALLSGLLAQEFCHSTRHFENAYLTALFMNLGQMLVEMHFPDDAQALRNQMAEWVQAHPDASDQATHEALQRQSRQLMGLTCEDIGVEVARQWGWPEDLTQSLRRHYPSNPEQVTTDEVYMRVLCTGANELSRRIHDLPRTSDEALRKEAIGECLRSFSASYAEALSLDGATLPETGVESLERWESLSEALGFIEPPAKGKSASTQARRPAAYKPRQENPERSPGRNKADSPAVKDHAHSHKPAQVKPATAGEAGSKERETVAVRRDPAAQARMTQSLSRALSEASQWALGSMPFEEVLDRTAQVLLEALEVQRVIIGLRHGGSGSLVGKLGKGLRSSAIVSCFNVPLHPPQDVFGILCTHGRDTLISDTRDPVVAARLPGWFQKEIQAGTFLLLPMTLGDKPIGVLYADRQEPSSLTVGEQDLTMLKALRNQLVMAIRLRTSQPLA